MSIIRAKVTIPYVSQLPEDSVVNTFHFITDTPVVAADYDNINGLLTAFYNGFTGKYSSKYQPENATLACYDLAEPEPRVPHGVNTDMGLTASPAGTTDLPSEVAVCLSFAGAPEAGVPPARRRGRVFLGPWTVGDAIDGDTGLVVAALRTSIANAAATLTNDDDVHWAVYSPTDDVATQVTHGWVDNAFDIQRRRGLQPTLRTTFIAL